MAGLIPFWTLSLAVVVGIGPGGYSGADLSLALATYAATIASFLGGIRWGLAVRESDPARVRLDYAVSVLPQLVAWGAMGLEGRLRLLVLALVLLITGPLDYSLVMRGLAPQWFGRLRVGLSLGAGAGLILAALA